jgi:membrane-associated phospholipid phosphatase
MAASATAAGAVTRDLASGLRQGWRATPPEERRRFWIRLLVATLAAAGASALTALWLPGLAENGLLPGDAALDEWMDGALSLHSALWVGAFTSSAMIMPIVGVAAVLQGRRGRWERAATMFVAYLASKAIIMAGWNVWDRDRPADVAGGDIVPADLSSYPSGHAVQTWTVYGLLALWWVAASDRWWEKALVWIGLLALSAVIAVGRVRIGAHNPSDVLGGIVLGAIWLAGAAWAEAAVGRRRDGAAVDPAGPVRAGGSR